MQGIQLVLPGGNPDISTDNYKKLLYGHPSSSTSYTTLRINGTNHIYGSGSFTTNPIIDAQANKNISEQKVGDVRVKQVLTLVKNTATDREDIVEIKYIIKNEGTTSASTGVRIMMDTMLGNNDAAPFRIPGVGEVTYEREYTGDNVPQYWQAFDSMTNPQVVSQGTLLRSSENKPDKVQFTNWRRVYNNAWDYNVSTSSQNGDSAVSVIWEPKNIAPGQEVEYATYYGLSELVQDLKPPLAVSLFGDASVRATQNGYEPNPFVVTVYVQNIGSASASNVKAKINLPTGLKLEGTEAATKTIGSISVNQEKQLSWSVSVDSSNADKTLEYSVDVWSDNTESKNVKKSIFIPRALDKKAIIFIPGITGSEIFTTEAFNSKTFLGKDFDFNYSNDYQLWDPASAAGKNTAQILLDRDRVKTDVRLLVCNESGDAIVPTEAKDLVWCDRSLWDYYD